MDSEYVYPAIAPMFGTIGVFLTGSNTYLGITTINGGTLQVSTTNATNSQTAIAKSLGMSG